MLHDRAKITPPETIRPQIPKTQTPLNQIGFNSLAILIKEFVEA